MKTLSNLLNGILHFGFTVLLKNWQKKIRRWYFLKKKTEKKQNSATIIISIDGKWTVFPVKLKYKGNYLNKDI